jgi:peptidyl-prolyl cis-trans isomerase B (cyclophilin B)
MKLAFKISFTLALLLVVFSCDKKEAAPEIKEEQRQKIEMITDRGTMVIELYNETPLHRDNFLKLVTQSTYDSVLFHRVINEFMIQSGDPDSKYAKPGDTLGNGGLDYTVDAEFNPNLFHKKGVLAAARDGNPERASSSTQFYIVQGRVFNDSLLDRAEVRINGWLAEHYFKKDPENKSLVDSLQKAIESENMEQYRLYNDSISSLSKAYKSFETYTISEEQRSVYKTLGGTPHLDQNYTIFGEVVEGLAVVDSIAATPTGAFDRPLTDVRIVSVTVLEE